MATGIRKARMITIGFAMAWLAVPAATHASPPWTGTCPGNTQHVYRTLKPSGGTYKVTEHICVNPAGHPVGQALLTFTDYTLQTPSWSLTGDYRDDGVRKGRWIIHDAAGAVAGYCVYRLDGSVKRGPALCSE
jgi:hypothetical protein